MASNENQYEIPICQVVQYSEIRRSEEAVVPTSVYTSMNGGSSTEYSFAQENRDGVNVSSSPYTLAGDNMPSEETTDTVNPSVIGVNGNQSSNGQAERVQCKKTHGIFQSLNEGSWITVTASILSTVMGIIAIGLACYSLNQVSYAIETIKSLSDNMGIQTGWSEASSTTPATTKPDIDECTASNDCHPFGSQCINTKNSYICICKPDWTGDGRNCTKITYRNCEDLRKVVGFNTGFYEITPSKSIPPFVVHCVMEKERGVTEIGHDSESRTHVKGCESAGCYSRNVTYNVSMEQIVSLLEVSTHCSQFIQYECHNSAIKSSNTNIAWWLSRNGSIEFWSGGEVIGSHCTCASNATCTGCHCDVNDSKWRVDNGYVINKFLLPITQLRFGDVNDSGEEGYHQLGKLRCYG